MLDQSSELAIARAVSARLTERGPFAADDCVMLIGSSVSGFGHARSDLDLLVCGSTPDRLPLHMFYEGRRVDVDFLYPSVWNETRGWVNTCARSITQPFEGRLPPPVDDRDWWADHLWLYDRVAHGVPITDRMAGAFLQDTTRDNLAAAIGNYSRALCARMMQRARMHQLTSDVEAACQYECEALLAAVEAVAATRGLTFWSDRTVLEKGRRVQTPEDRWDATDIERLFTDLVRRAWGAGTDRSDEVPGVVGALLGSGFDDDVSAAADATAIGRLQIELVDGWTAQVAGGKGFLLAPDRSLYVVNPSVARFVLDRGVTPSLARDVAAELVAVGAITLEPGGPARPVVQVPADRPALPGVCAIPVAPSPESWLSSRIAAQWYAMTVWSLSDDLHGSVESEQRNRIMPILRKAELFLRMMTIAITSVRSDVGRNVAMDLQGCVLDEGFHELLDLVYTPRPAEFRRIPELATSLFSSAMVACGMPARADMFERSRSFMKQLSDVRTWFRVSDGLGIPVQAPDTLLAKGGGSTPSGNSTIFVGPS